MAQNSSDRDGSRLCLECGICCQGVLHDKALIQTSEIAAARALGLNPQAGGAADGATFDLPCHNLCGAKCTVYDRRPSPCRGYECNLLVRYTAGEITFADASATVAEARRLVDRVRTTLRPGQTIPQARLEWKQDKTGAPSSDDPARDRQHQLSMVLLHLLVDRQFLRVHEDRQVVATDIAETRAVA